MRQFSKLFKVTFTCDNCSSVEIMELTAGQAEDEGYTGKWYYPPGWVLGHTDKPNTGDGIPTLQFCSPECRDSWLQRYINSIQAKFYV